MALPKKVLVAGAAVAAIGLATAGSIGLASAATSTNGGTGNTIADKIASKFNLNKSDVQAVFDEDRASREQAMQQRQADRLAQAVKDGKLTQDQADHITNVQKEIRALLGSKRPDQLDDSTKQQLKTKVDTLRQWAEDNNVDMRYVGPGGHGGPGGRGMGMGMHAGNDGDQDDKSGAVQPN